MAPSIAILPILSDLRGFCNEFVIGQISVDGGSASGIDGARVREHLRQTRKSVIIRIWLGPRLLSPPSRDGSGAGDTGRSRLL
jgi:hypothetical protein